MARIIFMGTPDFAVPALRRLIDAHQVVAVVTQPDRPAGRSREPRPSPVKVTALEHGIPVLQPEKIRRAESIEALRGIEADVYVVAAFGQILPQTLLDIPPHGSINIHASLLPRWRGAAPIHAAIRAGDAETGITIMRMDAGLDTGPILTRRAIPIAPDETGESLHDKLAALGGDLLIETLPGYLAGGIIPQPQDDAHSTYAPMIKKEEGNIDWAQDAAAIERLVRAFTPWPGTYSYWGDQPLKIISGNTGPGEAPPGAVIARGDAVAIGTGDGLFYPTRMQLAGRAALPIADFIRGRPDLIGSQLSPTSA